MESRNKPFKCVDCGKQKLNSEFYENPTSKRGFSRRCKECTKSLNSARYYEKREEILEQCKEYRKKNWEAVYAGKCRWAANNKEKIREISRRCYEKTKDAWLARCRARRKTPEFKKWVSEYKRNYRIKHLEYYVAKDHARRAGEYNGSPNVHTPRQWTKLLQACGYRCLCCGKSQKKLQQTLHADHIRPLSKGGSSLITNMQPLCLKCNAHKHTKTIDYRPKSIKIYAEVLNRVRKEMLEEGFIPQV